MAINKVIYDGDTLVDLTSDTVEPQYLVNGITAHDKSGASINGAIMNYIVEEGTSGDWYYRKWASGHAEAWAELSFSSTSPTTWANPIRYADKTASIPSGIFKNAPSKVFVVSSDNQWWCVGAWANSSTQLGMRFVKPASGASAITADAYCWGTASE